MAKKKNDLAVSKSNSAKVVARRNNTNNKLVTNCDRFIIVPHIESMIFTFRNVQVMVDRDLAMLYGEETKVMNQAIKRNVERFPERFRFQLTDEETDELVTNCDRLSSLKHSSSNPFVFTEQGIAMLSTVLRSDIAVSVSIQNRLSYRCFIERSGEKVVFLQQDGDDSEGIAEECEIIPSKFKR